MKSTHTRVPGPTGLRELEAARPPTPQPGLLATVARVARKPARPPGPPGPAPGRGLPLSLPTPRTRPISSRAPWRPALCAPQRVPHETCHPVNPLRKISAGMEELGPPTPPLGLGIHSPRHRTQQGPNPGVSARLPSLSLSQFSRLNARETPSQERGMVGATIASGLVIEGL